MNILALDTETPRFDKKELWRGNVYGDSRSIVCYSWANGLSSSSGAAIWEESSAAEVQLAVDGHDLIVGFNFKHDLAYLRRHGVSFSNVRIWDVQLAEFVLGRQLNKFPSLDDTCHRYGLPTKLDLVKEEFWENKCSCYVSLAERLVNIMLSNNVLAAIGESTNGKIDSAAMLKSELGEQLIQISTKLLKSASVQNLLQTLKPRLTLTSSLSVGHMDSHMLNTMSLWHEQAVKCVERLTSSASITATEQVKLEECCVDTVMQLLDISKNQNGWNKHHATCHPNPVDTCDVPPDLLCEYAALDAELTLKCYYAQLPLLSLAQRTLVSLMSQDLLVLQEMEQNGLIFDESICAQRSEQLDNEISTLTKAITSTCPAPINLASGDHLSAFLYGGSIKEDTKEFVGYFKTGAQKGLPKYKNVVKEHILPRQFEPLKGSELMKEGFYETNEGTLKKLKGKNKKLLDQILTLSKLEKLNGTYYRGLPKLREAMHWPVGKLHGQFNQTLAGTGRLSSSKPNQQNFASDIQDIFISQYE